MKKKLVKISPEMFNPDLVLDPKQTPGQVVLDTISELRDRGQYLDPADEFDKVIMEMKALHDKKKADYSRTGNRFSNFEEAALFSGITPEATFEVLLGIKQARLVNLRSNGNQPKNESIRDTLRDRAVYAILAWAYYDKVNGQ